MPRLIPCHHKPAGMYLQNLWPWTSTGYVSHESRRFEWGGQLAPGIDPCWVPLGIARNMGNHGAEAFTVIFEPTCRCRSVRTFMAPRLSAIFGSFDNFVAMATPSNRKSFQRDLISTHGWPFSWPGSISRACLRCRCQSAPCRL